MPQLYSTGPCILFAGIGSGGAPVMVGTGESAPVIEVRPATDPVMNDLGGSRIGFDFLYEGQDGIVSCDLNRYSESAYQTMADRAALASPPVPGTNLSGEVGTLLLSEGLCYPLWVLFPYATKAVFQSATNGAMPAGYHWSAAYLQGPDRLEGGSARARKINVVWHCVRAFNTGIPGPYNTGTFALYDFDMSAVANTPVF